MPSQLINSLTKELKSFNSDITPAIVAEAMAQAVTSTLAGNEAKVILRRVVEPEGQIALTELELHDDFLYLYPDEVEALRAMLIIWDADGTPKNGDLLLVSERKPDGSIKMHFESGSL